MTEHGPMGLGPLMQSLITGYIDHARRPQAIPFASRPFWLGVAIGAGAVLALKARSANTTETMTTTPGPSD